ncbi:MAG: protein-glutamate O-methyltransferase CheR [Bacteroidetes bacterium]|nr:protein-glutamate O-methyltransferase CheR [Bacteroidota bacterium]
MNEILNTSAYSQIISAVKESGSIDLSDYAVSSLRRRISRHMIGNNIADLDDLLAKIRNGNGFLETFIKDLTVNTTEMFRDPTFWTMLSNDVLPTIKSKERINIWHAACSTGEEVFSMAILLKELGMLDQAKIVATDINNTVLETAASCKFPLRSQEFNRSNYETFGGKGRLDDYYCEKQHQASYDTDLIRNVEFKYHNLAQDGVFDQFDLIICRNVMIYFNFQLQERVIGLFNDSLNPRGYLGIGSKESIVWCKTGRHFSSVCLHENIHRKKDI